jgi:hypothetical protein
VSIDGTSTEILASPLPSIGDIGGIENRPAFVGDGLRLMERRVSGSSSQCYHLRYCLFSNCNKIYWDKEKVHSKSPTAVLNQSEVVV